MNISFTGHRDYDKNRYAEALRTAIIELTNGEPSTCYSGMAVGFDLAAAECVIALRREGYALRLVCVVPFKGQASAFSAEDKARYAAVIEEADSVVTLASQYSVDTYHRRNDYLVEQADKIISYYRGDERATSSRWSKGGTSTPKKGGTAYTLRRARKMKVEVREIHPSQQLSLF